MEYAYHNEPSLRSMVIDSFAQVAWSSSGISDYERLLAVHETGPLAIQRALR